MNIKSLPAWVAFAAFVILCAACTGAENSGKLEPSGGIAGQGALAAPVLASADGSASDIIMGLEQIAEIERSGGFFPGMGLIESEMRERAGDYAGAAVAAYKELSWAYGYGAVSTDQIASWFESALALFEDSDDPQRNAGVRAIKGCMAFARGDWEEAERLLAGIHSPDEEPDSFLGWMLLVCALEQSGDEGRAVRATYGAIRARYMFFPEYWFRGALTIGVAYAEQCINISPQGPFAGACRAILARHFGILTGGEDIRTKNEIETILLASVSANNPDMLREIFPLLVLPDNPATLYALGTLQALSFIPEFRAFFAKEALNSSGRLAERLNFASRS